LLIGPGPREREIVEGLSAGADGFALTTDPVDVLLAAIRAVGSGQRHLPVGLRGLNDSSRIAVLATDLLAMLSRREREVLDLVIRGWRSSNIARELCVSIKTVETHRAHINRKLRCSSSSDLVRFAADNGLLPGAPSAGAGASRTFVLVVETDSPMKGELMRELAADGYERADASNVTSAMAQVEAIPPVRPLAIEAHGSASAPDVYDLLIRRGGTGPMPLVLALDGADDHRPTLRAIACLPQAEAGLGFLTALERAGANHALRLVDHATVA
jgi:DNA-binding CsgD family transcriptional regulator